LNVPTGEYRLPDVPPRMRDAGSDVGSIIISQAVAMLKHAIGVATVATLVLVPPAANATAPDAIVGTWLTEDGSSRVDIAATRGADNATVYAGRVSWLRDPTRDGKPLHDANNENPGLRDRPILGLEIVSGFKATAAGGWNGGKLYSPRNGKSYPAAMSLTPDGRLEFKVEAGFLTRTVHWTR
jgi:uncharacterized protein (DUF2147 family)